MNEGGRKDTIVWYLSIPWIIAKGLDAVINYHNFHVGSAVETENADECISSSGVTDDLYTQIVSHSTLRWDEEHE